MPKKVVLLIVVFLLVVAAAIGILVTNSNSSNSLNDDVNRSSSVSSENTSDQQPAQKDEPTAGGTYQPYDEATVANTKGTKLLFFHAPWCSQCRSIESGISPETIPKGVSIFKVDYDSRQDLRQQYGVTLQTTFIVLDENNQPVDKFVAYDTPTFDAVKEALL